MYILVEAKDKRILFESIESMNEHLKLNNLYPEVSNITEIDRDTFNEILRETAMKTQSKRKG